MNNLVLRAITGTAYVAITLLAAFAGPFTSFLLFLAVAVAAAQELHRLIWPPDQGFPVLWSMLLVAVVNTTASMGLFDPGWRPEAVMAMAFSLLLVAVVLMLWQGGKAPARDLGGLLLLVALIALPFSALIHLFDHGTWVFIGFMLLLWTNDTGAYLVGRSLGRTKLAPAISPNKTVEGFVGGLLLTMGVGFLLAARHPELDKLTWITCGGIVAVTSTLGDLLESAFKRAHGLKDSGSILPGHGGVLDRFDGVLLAAPAVFLYLALVR